MTTGTSYQVVRETEGSRNRDSTVLFAIIFVVAVVVVTPGIWLLLKELCPMLLPGPSPSCPLEGGGGGVNGKEKTLGATFQ